MSRPGSGWFRLAQGSANGECGAGFVISGGRSMAAGAEADADGAHPPTSRTASSATRIPEITTELNAATASENGS